MKKIKIIIIMLTLLVCNFKQGIYAQCDVRATSETPYELNTWANGPNPEAKSGWNLIFADGFNGTTIDQNKWFISGIGDDRDQTNTQMHSNPNNVSVSGGVCHLKLNKTPYNGLPVSTSEITTFRSRTLPGQPWEYKVYGFYEDTYTEARVKMPNGKGVGSAGWLWKPEGGVYREIDIWETYGITDPTAFQNTYHYGISSSDKSESIRQIRTKDNRYIDQDYYIFGLERTSSYLKLFINGECVRTINFDSGPNCSTANNIPRWVQEIFGQSCCALPYDKPNGIFALRFGTGGCLRTTKRPSCQSILAEEKNNVDCEGDDLDKELKIDYIRVYQKQGTQAVQINKAPTKICSSNPWLGETSVAAYSFYPDATYTWTSTSNALVFNDWGRGNGTPWLRCQILPRTSITGANQVLAVAGQTYPAKLTVTFPSGYQEVFDFNIQTSGNVPATPTVVPRAVLTNCRFPISVTGPAAPYSTVYSSTPINIGETMDSGERYNIKVCATNGCGMTCQTTGTILTTPNRFPGNCPQRVRDTTNQNTTFPATTDEPVASKTTTDDWSIYPNPSEQGESVHIITNGNYLGAWLTVTNVYGKTISRTAIVSDQTNVPTENWHSGIYFVAILDNQNHYLSTKKLIVP